MPRAISPDRFDEHFLVRTIRDFFVSLLIIIAVELGVRFAVMLWSFNTAEAARTELAAERLAEDVRAIMLNQGGPVVAQLARAGSELGHRAPVRSADEFGELAHDLNLFLDRLTQIIEDMSRVLAEIDDISARMQDLGDAIDRHARGLSAEVEARPRTLAAEADGLDALLAALAGIAAHMGLDADARARIETARLRLAEARATGDAAAIHDRLGALGGSAGDMRVLEERMRALSGEGQRLLARLGHARAKKPPAVG